MNNTTTLLIALFLLLSGSAYSGITWTYVPSDTTINCGDSEHFTNTGQPTAATDCAMGGISITFTDAKIQSGACIKDSVITRTWVVTDACANMETFDQVITIVDTTGPVTLCPSTQVLKALDGVDENILDYVPLASISDPCTDDMDLVIVQTPPAGTNLPLGSHTINIQATDVCGNSADCDFILEVYDTAGIYMQYFPNDTLVSCENTLDSALLGSGFAISTCPISEVSYDYIDNVISAGCEGADTIERVWTASDICGNSATYTQIIITEDTEAPFILCTVTDTTCNSTNGVNAFLGDYTTTAATIDNCSSVTVTQYPIPAAVIPIGVIDCWLFATDDCGNVDSCVLSVVIGDTAGLGIGIREYEMGFLEVYPNPSNGEFTFESNLLGENVQVSIHDLSGKIVYVNRMETKGINTINVEVDKGVYIFTLQRGEMILRKKIIIE